MRMHAAAAHMCMWWKDMLACGILEKEKRCVQRKQIKVACMLIPRTVPGCKEACMLIPRTVPGCKETNLAYKGIKQEAVHAKE
jgi:hypothetical protein